MTATLAGLRRRGRLLVVGAPQQPLAVSAGVIIRPSSMVAGHASGTAKASEDTLRFAALSGVRPMVETAPLEDAEQAYGQMLAGTPRFRMVLTT
jgi:D-arabinose 1-dehydrogenase-like Zn-dependent alcohol dehydrogenase